ncbi:LytR/AlgR family response regulator transcription factor [Lapidilactobacillus wuchangensis]|uniref:LytR/AlgR family response regulator transcription factor n=1 Tax=Lapidilactobacillus wuchangensis TaxID=2486001 RepID=UPI0013DE5FC6|nr:LytTR family DNA-binding domain-containing protein [Lapidilactobacillus wuchangensis]
MLNVYILEDDERYLAFLKQSVSNTIMIEDISVAGIVAEKKPDALLNAIELNTLNTAIFFLDIEIIGNKNDGITVADWVRSKSPYAEIVFVTSHSEAAMRIITHRIAPLDLINKSASNEGILTRIHSDIVTMQQRQNNRQLHSQAIFSYTIGQQVFSIPLTEVEYIQTIPGRPGELEVRSINESATFSGNLNQIEAKFPSLFRCHKSVIVNPKQIKSLNTGQRLAYFKSGSKIDVSFRKLSSLKKIMLCK